MLPVTNKAVLPDRSRLRVADQNLQNVLDGRAYLVFDGAMGTMFQQRDLEAGHVPEILCLEHPDEVTAIHRAYIEAGSHVATTNTFGANRLKLEGRASVEEVYKAAIACARASGARYVAADLGPTGALLEPMGTLSFDRAYELFAEQARAAQEYGAHLIIIETMTDLLEMKAAVLAAKEHTNLPIFATMTYDDTGRTFLGCDPRTATVSLCALGVNAVGVNCSLGPTALVPLVEQILEVATCPVIVQANAGLPSIVNGKSVYSVGPRDYLDALRPMIQGGASVLGGCCGTSPDHIHLIAQELQGCTPPKRTVQQSCAVASGQQTLVLEGSNVAVVGERINPTGKKRLQEALRGGDYDYVVGQAIAQAQAGADVLDVNAGLPDIDEAAVLCELVKRIQGACPLPLQIDSTDPRALEAAVRSYAGKPLINSVNGKQESLDAVLPIAAHYGCAVVGLTLDEDGIPPTAQGRLAIAQRIVAAAQTAGIPRNDVLIDCLAMSAATNQSEAMQILHAIALVKEHLGVRTVLGVSNISFGLPARPVVNATFLSAAFGAGLDMPILDPLNERYRQAVDAWRVLCTQDKGAQSFIERYAGFQDSPTIKSSDQQLASHSPATPENPADRNADASDLYNLVVAGMRGPVPDAVDTLLQSSSALEVIDGHLIPALDDVGQKYEDGTFFLPQLMASAEAAKAAFDRIRQKSGATGGNKGLVVLATVKGDIHDIGKNIVKMLLENYGYRVLDLGRDVDPQRIVDQALEHDARIVGLSALMTTTVKSMEETIALLHEQAPQVKVMVGGAVLTQAYADMIGADFYGKDAAASARYTGQVLG